MGGDFNSDFDSDFGDGRPPRRISELPCGAVGGVAQNGWCIWPVDSQAVAANNAANADVFSEGGPYKRFRLVVTRDVYHDVSPSNRRYRMLDATQPTITDYDEAGQLVKAYRLAVEDKLGFTPEPLFSGVIAEED